MTGKYMTASKKQEWFDKAGGLAFSCTQCGQCCSGPSGYVIASEPEIEALAEHFKMTPAQFKQKYMNKTRYGMSMNEKESVAGLDCVFLDRETIPGKSICSIYHLRPAQCRTWPFWRSNLASAQRWQQTQQECPGAGHGDFISLDEIESRASQIEL